MTFHDLRVSHSNFHHLPSVSGLPLLIQISPVVEPISHLLGMQMDLHKISNKNQNMVSFCLARKPGKIVWTSYLGSLILITLIWNSDPWHMSYFNIFKPPHLLENCNTPKSDSIAPVGCAESVNHLAYQLHIKLKFKSSECLEMRFLQIPFEKKAGEHIAPKAYGQFAQHSQLGHACCLNVAPENSKAKCIQTSLEQAVSVTETLKSCTCYRSERCNKRTKCIQMYQAIKPKSESLLANSCRLSCTKCWQLETWLGLVERGLREWWMMMLDGVGWCSWWRMLMKDIDADHVFRFPFSFINSFCPPWPLVIRWRMEYSPWHDFSSRGHMASVVRKKDTYRLGGPW